MVTQWLAERGRSVGAGSPELIDGPVPLVRLTADGRPFSMAVVPLFDVAADAETTRRRVDLEHQLSAVGSHSVALWVPPGAPIPIDDAAGVSERVAEAAANLEPGGRCEVGFPVTLELRRNGNEGTYMSVVGGLSPHWARFTNRVFGYYQLDSSPIHRLPEDQEKVTQLIDFTVLVANGVRQAGGRAEVAAEDAWSLQRLDGLTNPTVVTASPEEHLSDGALVRRTLRDGLKAAVAALDAGALAEGEGRAVAVVGVYRSVEDESASAALRGMDPGLFAGLDFACLLADGKLKPLLGPRPESALA